MGRPAALWLQRAYEILSDGRWHTRDRLITEMAKVVPPGVARRRGEKTNKYEKQLTDAEFIRRGARHVAAGSLTRSAYVERREADGLVMFRLASSAKPAPVIVTAADGVTWSALTQLAVLACRDRPELLEELGFNRGTFERLQSALEEV